MSSDRDSPSYGETSIVRLVACIIARLKGVPFHEKTNLLGGGKEWRRVKTTVGRVQPEPNQRRVVDRLPG